MKLKRLLPRCFRRKVSNMVLQEHFFRAALAEVGIDPGHVRIEHRTGTCIEQQVGEVPIVFPLDLLQSVAALPQEKSQDYFFRGMLTAERSWILHYPDVQPSSYGRNPVTKYVFHKDYYAGLSRSQFGLAPVGDCPWSYRFFESIMCYAVPVLGDEDEDIFASGFFHYRHSDEKAWLRPKCMMNYLKLLDHHTLPGRIPELRARLSSAQNTFFKQAHEEADGGART